MLILYTNLYTMQNKTEYLHLYSKFVNSITNLYREIDNCNDNVKAIILWAPEELLINWLKPQQKLEVEEYIRNLGMKFFIYTNKEIPLFWAYHTLHGNLVERKQLPLGHDKLKRVFITLNGKGWGHRCQFIDKLAEHDLLKNNYYSWNLWENQMVNSKYKFNYFDGNVKELDSPIREKNSQDYYSIPKEFNYSLFSVICETSLSEIFYTEKLWHAIYHKRPFLVYGAQNYHHTLKNLGFKLFDNIIDYSFDKDHRTHIRLDGMANELKKLQAYSESLKKLKKQLDPIIEHNFQHMLHLLDRTVLPEHHYKWNQCKYQNILQINTLQKVRKLMTW